jgi:uncharacterized membrane protein YdbT with pleckstrin-like domain
MNTVVTEKDYPIETIWIFKRLVIPTIFLIIVSAPFIITQVMIVIFDLEQPEGGASAIVDMAFIGLFILGYFITNILSRKYFHYSLEDRFLNIKQGILSKKQRDIPYEVIQDIVVKQDLFDRIFSLASVNIYNASQAGGALGSSRQSKFFGFNTSSFERKEETIGFEGNKVAIPGLRKENAEALKEEVLKKMKDNPIKTNISGL